MGPIFGTANRPLRGRYWRLWRSRPRSFRISSAPITPTNRNRSLHFHNLPANAGIVRQSLRTWQLTASIYTFKTGTKPVHQLSTDLIHEASKVSTDCPRMKQTYTSIVARAFRATENSLNCISNLSSTAFSSIDTSNFAQAAKIKRALTSSKSAVSFSVNALDTAFRLQSLVRSPAAPVTPSKQDLATLRVTLGPAYSRWLPQDGFWYRYLPPTTDGPR